MWCTSEESSENVRSQNLDTRFTSRTNCFLANLRIWLYMDKQQQLNLLADIFVVDDNE